MKGKLKGVLMLIFENSISKKYIFIGTVIIFLLTSFVRRILYNTDIIQNKSVIVDFFVWIIIFFVLSLFAFAIAHILHQHKKSHLIIAYILAVLLVIALAIAGGFGFKMAKINNYESTLTLMTEKQPVDVKELLKQESDFIFFITSEDCPYCVDFLPTIEDDVLTNSSLPVYYLLREKDIDSEIRKLFEVKTIPFLIRIENGKVVQNYFENPIDFFR